MCQKRSSVNVLIDNHESLKRIRVDPCIRDMIRSLNSHEYNTVASCCGHGMYPLTVVCQVGKQNRFYDLISGVDIPRTRRFYKKDSDGFYYIPEVSTEVML